MMVIRGGKMRIYSYGGLMALSIILGWIALSHADGFLPFNRKPTLATDTMVLLPENVMPAGASLDLLSR